MNVKEIGNKIKQRRAALQMTQKDLANAMNVSNQLISKWETGESVPALEYLDALCKALNVDYSYFTSDGDFAIEQPAAVRSTQPEKQRKRKWSWKLFAIILSAFLTAAFACGLILLTYYVFVPAANRTRYIEGIEKAYENYFELGYYSIAEKTELDGDLKDDYRYEGYFDESGKPVLHDTKSKKTVKNDILTFDEGEYKYHFVSDKTYKTVEELAFAQIAPEDDKLGLWDDEVLDKIRYIRKVGGGYYIEFKDEYFTDELGGTQKKNYKLTEKIKGKIEIKDGLYNFMEVTVKFLNKPDNEHFTIKASFEFIAEKPVIEHKNIDNRDWNGTYVDDTWYPSGSTDNPDIPIEDKTPKCENLLSVEEVISRLSGGTAQRIPKDFDFNELVLSGKIQDGGDCLYYVDGNNVEILNKTNLSKKTTITLTPSNEEISNVYVYGGKIFYTDCRQNYYGNTGYFKAKTISTGVTSNLFPIESGSDAIIYKEKFAVYFGYKPGTYTDAENVIDLTRGKIIYSYSDISYYSSVLLDSYGNIYYEKYTDGKIVPQVYKNGNCMALKGKEYFRTDDGMYSKIYIDGDSICTYENDTVYRYENGELKETLTSSDVRFKKNYAKLTNGYCIMHRGEIYDENGEERNFETFMLKDEDGKWQTVYGYTTKEIIAIVNGKLIVPTDYFGDYLAIYDENDLTKPLYYMKGPAAFSGYCEYDKIEILRVGTSTIIAVRINTVDYYGYELYCF